MKGLSNLITNLKVPNEHLNKKYIFWFLLSLVVVGIYIFSKNAETKKVEYYKSEAPEFKKGQLIEKQSVNFYRNKDKLFRQETRELKVQNKELKEKFEKIERKFDELVEKSKKKQLNANDVTVTDSEKSLKLIQELLKTNPSYPNIPPEIRTKLQGLPVERTITKPAASTTTVQRKPKPITKDTLSFPVKKGKARKLKGPVLPSGSFAKGTILTGIDAPTGKTLPSLIELDFAYVAPNNFKIDLQGCFLILKSSADISSERVEMQPQKISCVSKSGAFFEKKTNGYVADGFDNRFAMKGKLIENFGSKLLKATLASALEGAGKAIQLSQTTTNTNPLGGQSTTVSGNTGKLIAGGAASSAASTIAKWYLGQVQKMMPVIRVESGKTVWIVMTEKIELPRKFFKKVTKEKVNVPIKGFTNHSS